MSSIIEISRTPNQRLFVTPKNQDLQIILETLGEHTYATVYADNLLLSERIKCNFGISIVQFSNKLNGYLFFFNKYYQKPEYKYPYYDDFGISTFLYYYENNPEIYLLNNYINTGRIT